MMQNLLNQKYIILRELGSKPSRKTYLAEDIQTQNQVVVKLLYLGLDFDWQDLKLFEREAQTLQQLNHPQIPKYLDSFEFDLEDEKGFALVQEYIPGESLEIQLRAGRVFSETEVIKLARSLLSILIYLHSCDPPIIHRDIKPSNIVITNRSAHHVGDVFLVDFGSVQNIAATEGSTITVVGTYGYMPPEQFGGRTTPASDLYSLGATIIFLVTGLHPSELPERELRIQFRNHCQIATSLADWLEWMSEPSQTKRFKTAQLALEKLDNPPPRPVIPKQTSTNSPIQLISKPQGSKITVQQKADYLDIIFPAQGLGFLQIIIIFCAAPLGIIGGLTMQFPIEILPGFTRARIIAIALIVILLLWSCCKRTRLRLYKKHIYLHNEIPYYERYGYQWYQEILGLKYNVHSLIIKLDFLVGDVLKFSDDIKLLIYQYLNEIRNKIDRETYSLYDFHHITLTEKNG
ncbi:serine/threonine protein kinase [Nostoc sp. CCY0012]|uniref:serine/threonine protein kinase n=1 Tax=Nostoc sp. CCY0012 TaxID=1056123 RepID=UPI0039C60FB2